MIGKQSINQFLRPRLSLLDSEAVLPTIQAATKSERLTAQSLRNTDSPHHPLLLIISLPRMTRDSSIRHPQSNPQRILDPQLLMLSNPLHMTYERLMIMNLTEHLLL